MSPLKGVKKIQLTGVVTQKRGASQGFSVCMRKDHLRGIIDWIVLAIQLTKCLV